MTKSSVPVRRGVLLLTYVWAIEITGVFLGIVNSAYTTFGDNMPTTLVGWVPAVPMVTLAVAELGRVPLASAIYAKTRIMQCLAFAGLVALTYPALENWTIGVERVVNLRLDAVNKARAALAKAEAEALALRNEDSQERERNRQQEAELRTGRTAHDDGIAGLVEQQKAAAETYQQNLAQIRDACRYVKGACIKPRSDAEDRRYRAEIKQLNEELGVAQKERKDLLSQMGQRVNTEAGKAADRLRMMTAAAAATNDARQLLRRAADDNWLSRLAASWYRVSTSDLTPAQYAAARWVFSISSAAVIALIGTIGALVHYSRNRVPGVPSFFGALLAKVARSRRAYYARMRKAIVREVPGPERVIYRDGKEPAIVVEKVKEIPRMTQEIVLVPVRGLGISSPVHVNSLIRQGGALSNVVSLDKERK